MNENCIFTYLGELCYHFIYLTRYPLSILISLLEDTACLGWGSEHQWACSHRLMAWTHRCCSQSAESEVLLFLPRSDSCLGWTLSWKPAGLSLITWLLPALLILPFSWESFSVSIVPKSPRGPSSALLLSRSLILQLAESERVSLVWDFMFVLNELFNTMVYWNNFESCLPYLSFVTSLYAKGIKASWLML